MPEPESVGREHLGKVAAARYEAQTFMSQHPEFFATPANGQAITDYLLQHNLILTAENFEHAFEKLKAQGKLLPAREALARMSANEFKEFTKTHGVPVRDEFGNLSHELPEVYFTTSSEDYNRPRQRYTEATLPSHPEDARRKVSKREFNSWGADRAREYLQMIGAWGGPLPEHLR